MDFTPFNSGNTAAQEHCFDFLGYRFSVSLAHRPKGKICRDAWVDIAPSKVRKLKTQIVEIATRLFEGLPTSGLLHSRFQLLHWQPQFH